MAKLVLTYNGSEMGAWPLLDTPLIAGRASHAQIFIESPAVAETHCMIEPAGDIINITDMGSDTGTLVNGQPISKATIKAGDIVTIGPYTLTVVGGEEAALPDAEDDEFYKTMVKDMQPALQKYNDGGLVLQIREKNLTRKVKLEKPLYIIGTAEDCDIVLEGKGIAANHAVLIMEPDGTRMVNVSGKKDITMGGRPAMKRMVVTEGTAIGIGSVTLTLARGEA